MIAWQPRCLGDQHRGPRRATGNMFYASDVIMPSGRVSHGMHWQSVNDGKMKLAQHLCRLGPAGASASGMRKADARRRAMTHAEEWHKHNIESAGHYPLEPDCKLVARLPAQEGSGGTTGACRQWQWSAGVLEKVEEELPSIMQHRSLEHVLEWEQVHTTITEWSCGRRRIAAESAQEKWDRLCWR